MVDKEEFHGSGSGTADLLGLRLDREPLLQRHGARGLDLRDPFDLDQAHPALSDDRQPRVIAEVRDVDAGELGRVDQVHVLRDLDRTAVEEDGEGVLGRGGSLAAHAITSAFFPTRHRFCSTWWRY